MDGTASGINSSDTMEADIGEPIEERQLISEIEGENHGLSITNLCLSFSVSVTDFILIVLSSENTRTFCITRFRNRFHESVIKFLVI